jgi:phosphonate transport system permease protein
VSARHRTPRAARWWRVLAAVAILWSLWGMGLGREQVWNPAGLPSLQRFAAAALHPDLTPDYLLRTLDASATTVAFSLLGTVLATLIGLAGGIVMSEAWGRGAPISSRDGRGGALLVRLLLGIPRGVHEAVWAIGLLLVLGRDPLVGVLALAVPFGAITAKVFAEIIDESPSDAHDALRAAGAGRLQALCYGTLPQIWGDLLAYAFYRFDCALRSAVILGMIGVGGLGFELSTAFAGLNYERMWTLIYALILLGLLFDRWSASLRRRGGPSAAPAARSGEGAGPVTGGAVPVRWARVSLALGLVLTVASILHLRLDLGTLLAPSTWRRAAGILAEAVPPTLPSTWADLLGDAAATLQMSIVAIVVGGAIGVLAAFLGAPGPGAGVLGRAVAGICRIVLLTIRAVSPPVWALLLLFVVLPGPLPGALALGLYNAGVLGRLFAETLEMMDRRPAQALQQLGAGPAQVFVHGVLPAVSGRFSAYALYRWEVAIRESVVVGVVGAGGLGRVLETERATFDHSGMLTAVLALLVLSLLVDAASAAARRAWR